MVPLGAVAWSRLLCCFMRLGVAWRFSWCGLVWLVVAWCGSMWLGVAWCGLARLGMAWLRLGFALLGTRFPALLGAAQCYLEVGARRGLVGTWLGGWVVGGCVRVRVGFRLWFGFRFGFEFRLLVGARHVALGSFLVVGVHYFVLGVCLVCTLLAW